LIDKINKGESENMIACGLKDETSRDVFGEVVVIIQCGSWMQMGME